MEIDTDTDTLKAYAAKYLEIREKKAIRAARYYLRHKERLNGQHIERYNKIRDVRIQGGDTIRPYKHKSPAASTSPATISIAEVSGN